MPAESPLSVVPEQVALSPLEAELLFETQLGPDARAIYLLGRCASGNLTITETNEQGVSGYTLASTGKSSFAEDVMLAVILEPDLPCVMPQPATEQQMRENLVAFEAGKHALKVDGIVQASLFVRSQMIEHGYLNNIDYVSNAQEKLRKRFFLPSAVGLAVGVGVGFAARSEIAGFVSGIGLATVYDRARLVRYHMREAKHGKLLEKGLLTQKGKDAAGQLRNLHTDMQAVVNETKTATPRQTTELLPYAVVFGMHEAWLKTSAAQAAYAESPEWFKPLDPEAENQSVTIEKFINFCIASAFQPGTLHQIGLPSYKESRQEAITQFFEGLKNIADLAP